MQTIEQTNNETVVTSKTTSTHPVALEKAVEEAASIVSTITENELEKRYSLGEVVVRVQERSTYGDRAVAALATGTNLDVNTLRAHAAVADTWSAQEFSALTKLRGIKNCAYRLSWSHFVLVAGVKDDVSRDALISAALKEALTEKQLRARRAELSPRSQQRRVRDQAEALTASSSMAKIANELAVKGAQLNTLLELSSSTASVAELIAELTETEEVLTKLDELLTVTRSRLAAAVAASRPARSVTEAVENLVHQPAHEAPHRHTDATAAQLG